MDEDMSLTTYAYEIIEQMTENHEKFVFEQIKPWCEQTTKMVISKQILCRALQCFQKEHFDEYTVLQKLAESEEM